MKFLARGDLHCLRVIWFVLFISAESVFGICVNRNNKYLLIRVFLMIRVFYELILLHSLNQSDILLHTSSTNLIKTTNKNTMKFQ